MKVVLFAKSSKSTCSVNRLKKEIFYLDLFFQAR